MHGHAARSGDAARERCCAAMRAAARALLLCYMARFDHHARGGMRAHTRVLARHANVTYSCYERALCFCCRFIIIIAIAA